MHQNISYLFELHSIIEKMIAFYIIHPNCIIYPLKLVQNHKKEKNSMRLANIKNKVPKGKTLF